MTGAAPLRQPSGCRGLATKLGTVSEHSHPCSVLFFSPKTHKTWNCASKLHSPCLFSESMPVPSGIVMAIGACPHL